MNKKGQEMSVTTLILIVLGVVLLVMLILGFSMGWQNLWGKINIFGGGSTVESVLESCKLATETESVFTYCNEFKKVTIDKKTQYVNCEAFQIINQLDKRLKCTDNMQSRSRRFCLTGIKQTDFVNGYNCSDWNSTNTTITNVTTEARQAPLF